MDLQKLLTKGPILAWIIVAAFLVSLTLFGSALLWTYWADEIDSPALNEASYPPPTHGGW